MIIPSLPLRPFVSCWGATPLRVMDCHSLIYYSEREDTPHIPWGTKNSLTRDITLPLAFAAVLSAIPPLFKQSSKHYGGQSQSLTLRGDPGGCRADRGVLSCRGHSPSTANQISCRCSWINDLHQWRALTVNIPVSNPTPILLQCIFFVSMLLLHARCGWWLFTVLHSSVSLFSCQL